MSKSGKNVKGKDISISDAFEKMSKESLGPRRNYLYSNHLATEVPTNSKSLQNWVATNQHLKTVSIPGPTNFQGVYKLQENARKVLKNVIDMCMTVYEDGSTITNLTHQNVFVLNNRYIDIRVLNCKYEKLVTKTNFDAYMKNICQLINDFIGDGRKMPPDVEHLIKYIRTATHNSFNRQYVINHPCLYHSGRFGAVISYLHIYMMADEDAAAPPGPSQNLVPSHNLQRNLGHFLSPHARKLDAHKNFTRMDNNDSFWADANKNLRIHHAFVFARRSLSIRNSVLGVLNFMRQALNHATDDNLNVQLGLAIDYFEVEDYLHAMFPLYLPTLVEILIVHKFPEVEELWFI